MCVTKIAFIVRSLELIIVDAAATKIVPTAENAPFECAKTNVCVIVCVCACHCLCVIICVIVCVIVSVSFCVCY